VQLALEQRALNAARAVATSHGLLFEQANIVQSGSNVLVRLSPLPVVARVMAGTVVLHDDPERWLAREVAVLEFLSPSRLAVAPSRLIAPGPHQHDGLWMTFTEWIPGVQRGWPPADPAYLGRSLRTLHDHLRAFDGELGSLSDLRDDILRVHGRLRPTADLDEDSIASLRTRLDDEGGAAFGSSLPVQAIHGDASVGNLLHTRDRLIWNDFEDTFRGPVHWDLAAYVMSLRGRGATEGFVREVLDHYGWDSEQELAPFVAAQEVYDEIWRLYDRQRRQ
jgi:hypothetical protein